MGEPYVLNSETSYLASKEIEPNVATLRQRVLKCIAENGPISDEKISELTGIVLNTVRPRRVQLATDLLIERVGFGKTKSNRKCQLWAIKKF